MVDFGTMPFLSFWDEWVGLDRLMKNTDENKKKHEYLNQKQGTDKNAKLTRTAHTRTAHTKPKASRGKKRKNDCVCKHPQLEESRSLTAIKKKKPDRYRLGIFSLRETIMECVLMLHALPCLPSTVVEYFISK